MRRHSRHQGWERPCSEEGVMQMCVTGSSWRFKVSRKHIFFCFEPENSKWNLGKHESPGDTNSNSSHSFWDLEVMKYLDPLSCDVIKDPGTEWLWNQEAGLCVYSYTPLRLVQKTISLGVVSYTAHVILSASPSLRREQTRLVTGECYVKREHQWYENTYIESATNFLGQNWGVPSSHLRWNDILTETRRI